VLKSISLENFRGFADHKIEFGPETILIGKNNAGKTTVIEALRIISVCQARIPTAIYQPVPAWLDGYCGGAGFSLSLETIDFDFANVHHEYNSSQPAIIRAKNSNHSEVTLYIGQNNSEVFCQLKNNQRAVVHSRSTVSRDFGRVRVMPPIGSLLAHEKNIAKDRLRKYLNGYLAYRHFRNQLWERPADYRTFKALLEDTWNGLKIQHLENDHGEAKNEFSLLVREGRFTSEISWHGHGLQAWMQTVWFLSRNEKSSTIVLDEPDVYLHADLQRKLIKLIESLNFRQAILATHSSEIIGDVPFSHVTVVQKRERVSKPATMATEIQSAVKSMGSLHSIQLAKVAYHGLIFLVEGDDKPFLTDVAYKMGPRKFDAFASMAIQEIKGKGNWEHAIGAGKALREASSGEIKTALLLDRDYMLDEQVDEYYRKAQKNGLILKIWKSKEIENYFVKAPVITRFLIDRGGVTVEESEIEDLIRQCEIEMEEDTVLSFADVIQASTLPRIASKTAFQRAKALLAERLDSGQLLRDVVGGKDLITKLSKKCQENYAVSFSPLGLCKVMLLSEIPPEVTELVDALTQPKTLKAGAL
jgi:predicted ATPase